MTTAVPAAVGRRQWRGHLLGVICVLGAAGALVAPALAHGTSLGPIDWLSQFGLSARHGVAVNNRQTFDQVTEMIPWTSLGWAQVHHGHLPLWNPYSGLGSPLAFNWQAASFSLPALVSYLAPQHLAYTVEVLMALALAGTGVYVLAAVMRLGVLGCVMAATVFELSGPLVGWLGWPVAWVMAWAGWVFAATVVVLRGRHRGRAVIVLALAVAATVYAGQPDTLVLLGLATALFVVASLAGRAPALGGSGPVLRPLVDVVAAGVAGLALSAPLLLPGVQLARGSVRADKGQSQILSLSDSVHFLVSGFDGLPVIGSQWFGPGFYVHTAAYIGVVGLALAALGVAVAVRRRGRYPEAAPMAVVAVGAAAVVFVPVVLSLLEALPAVGPITWNRALLPLDFALAVLAGVGADVVARSWDHAAVRRWTWAVFGGGAVALGAVWLFGRGRLRPVQASVRAHSFLWPGVAAAAALGVLVLAAAARGRLGGRRAPRHRRNASARVPADPGATPVDAAPRHGRLGPWVAAGLIGIESVLLVGAGAPLLTSSPTALAPTSAERTLARTVGAGLVGFGSNACFTSAQLGVVPDVNVAYGVREFAIYDPVLPQAYYRSWLQATGLTGAAQVHPAVPFSLFCPALTSTALARRYGVAFILEPAHTAGPPGTTEVRAIGDEVLYRVPGAARATLLPAPPGAALPGADARGAPVSVRASDPATWVVTTRASVPSVLRLRLSAVPGWHATVDGRAVALTPYAGIMLQLRVPAGRHRVVVTYAPAAFTLGLVLAALSVVALVVIGAGGIVLRRRRRAVSVGT